MPSKLELFPEQTTIDSEGCLCLAGHRAVDLAARFGTPLYVYHLDTIRRQIVAYRQALAAYPGSARLTYASKAFLGVALAQFMTRQQVDLEIASAGELYIARQGGANPAQMHLHGNYKTPFDLQAALQAGVGRIVVDNPAELAILAKMALDHNQPVNIWLRITPDIALKTVHPYTVTGTKGSKFGMSPAQATIVATQLLREKKYPLLHLTGLHTHLGSQFHDPEPVIQAVDRLLDLAQQLHHTRRWTCQELSPGGGWGVPYHPADPSMPIQTFVDRLVQAVTAGCRRRRLPLPTLVLEPGRSLVAQAGVALYTVGNRKTTPGSRPWLTVDGGLADNPRPALYHARYTAVLANRANEPETETVAVAGPYCESGDVLIEAVDLPPARPGDLLAIPVSGAYQLSMSSNYNGARRPAVVFLEGGEAHLVQRRETLSDLVNRDRLVYSL